nr:type II and III secretion system protein family protein [Comamonas thiooxydans]
MLLASSVPVLAQSAGTPAQPGPVAAAAPAAPRTTLPARNCTAIHAEDPTTVTLGKSVVIPLNSPMARILVSGQTPGVGQAAANGQPQMQVQNGMGDIEVQLLSPRDLFFRGRKSGSMNVILQNAQGACFIKDVIVTMDPGPLQTKLSELMPEERGIRVQGADNALVLSGEISNPLRLDDVVTLAGAYSDSKKIVNLLRTTSPHQVMLEVKIAEVSKTLLDKLGASLAGQRITSNGMNTFSIASNFLSGGGGLLSAMRIGKGSISIDGQKDDGLVRILAEPNIMAISGQQASFLSGGKIFIPVSQSNTNGVPVMTLEEKEFGIGVKFMPTVLGSSRVNLKLVSEVSDLSQTGSPFTAINGVTSVIPSLSVRRADTTVQLNDGQSLVIAGLIKNNITEAVKRFPGLGEIPVLGALARSTEFQTDQTELMFIITPRLVQALTEAPRVPTDNHVPPSRAEVYLNGALESSKPASAAKTAPAATMPATTATPVQAPVPAATPQELQPQAPVEPSVDRPAPLNPPT